MAQHRLAHPVELVGLVGLGSQGLVVESFAALAFCVCYGEHRGCPASRLRRRTRRWDWMALTEHLWDFLVCFDLISWYARTTQESSGGPRIASRFLAHTGSLERAGRELAGQILTSEIGTS